MPVRYDPLLVLGLAREIADRWGGARVTALRLDRDRRAACLRFEDGSGLLSLLHPTAGHLLEVGPEIEAAGDEIRYRRLFLGDVQAPDDERALIVEMVDGGGRARQGLALELQTNQWNALALAPRDGDGWRIDRALWARTSGDRRLAPGTDYAPPRSTRAGVESIPDPEAWAGSLAGTAPDELRGAVLSNWAFSSALNVGWILGEPAEGSGRQLEDEALAAAYGRYAALRADPPEGRANTWLVRKPWGLQPYVAALEDPAAAEADSLLDAMAGIAAAEGGPEGLLDAAGPAPGTAAASRAARETAHLEVTLRDLIARLERRAAALHQQLEEAASPARPRTLGHILLANKTAIRRGAEHVRLNDFEGGEVDIHLDPALDVIGNAEMYFGEARRRERALERLPARIAETEARVAELQAAVEALDPESENEAAWELVGGRAEEDAPPQDRGASRPHGHRKASRGATKRLPYTRFRTSGGLEIRVGKRARDNDALTFKHSAPDDIWMHARQVKGAHVILRWGRKDDNPPKRDLLEAAVAAAVHSGGRHSGTVAVDWTRRKYVRKPRKARPGSVAIERVKTLFVTPDEALIERLAVDL